MKKRAICILVAALILSSLTACNVENTAGTIVSEIIYPASIPKMNIPTDGIMITCPSKETEEVCKVEIIDESFAITVCKESDSRWIIYRTNMSDNCPKKIYSAFTFDYKENVILIRSHINGTYSVSFDYGTILIFDKKTDQLLKTVDMKKVPDLLVVSYFNISNSGEKVVYSSYKGVCTANLDLSGETVLFSSEERTCFLPQFSPDDSKVVFVQNDNLDDPEDNRKCVIVELKTKKTIEFDCYAVGLLMMKNGFVVLKYEDNDLYCQYNGKEITRLPLCGEDVDVTKDYVIYLEGKQVMILNPQIGKIWNSGLNVKDELSDSYYYCLQSGNILIDNQYRMIGRYGLNEQNLKLYDIDKCVSENQNTASAPLNVSEMKPSSNYPEITCPGADGVNEQMINIDIIDENSVIVVNEVYNRDSMRKIYRVDIHDYRTKLIYSGYCPGDATAMMNKTHFNGTYSISFDSGIILVFDLATDQLLKKIDFSTVPDIAEDLYFDISNDGKKVVYTSNKGICTSDLDFTAETVVYEAGKQPYSCPLFSADDSKIAFTVQNGPDDITDKRKCVIIDLITKKTTILECDAEWLLMLKGEKGLIILNHIESDLYYNLDSGQYQNLPYNETGACATADCVTYFKNYGQIMIWNPKSGKNFYTGLNGDYFYSQTKNVLMMSECIETYNGETVTKVCFYDIVACKNTSSSPSSSISSGQIEPVINTGN